MKPAVALIEEDKVRTYVVGDIEVDPTVIVEVRSEHPEAAAVGAAEAGGLGHIREGPVPVVSVKDMPGGRNRAGRAVDPLLGWRVLHQGKRLGIAVTIVIRELPGPIVGHVEVEIAIVVVVEEGPAGGPAGPVDPG